MRRLALLCVLALGLLSGAAAQNLHDFAAQTGVRVFWEPYRDMVLFSDSHHRLALDVGSGLALGDGATTFTLEVDPVTGALSGADYQKLVAWWGKPTEPPSPAPTSPLDRPRLPSPGSGPRIQVLVLDAGHGGSDPGSIGRHVIDGKPVVLQEKDLTLAVVLELQKLLSQTYPDRNIVLTRRDDSYPTLEKRVQIAHAQKLGERDSILFLSVHFNASLNRRAKGVELWYVPQDYEREVIPGNDIPESVFPVLNTLVDSEYKKESREFAVQLAKGLSRELGDESVNRGLKANPWFVVRMARMPAVLAELGFITNPDEAARLRDPEYLKRLAHGLYNGVVSFIQNYEDHP